MPLIDIFKRKKTEEKKVQPKKEVKEVETSKEKPVEVKAPKIKKEVRFTEAYRILKTPHVTEKASVLLGKNQYVFKVYPRANKVDVKKSIEKVFGVDVIGVRIINIPKKKRKLGKVKGFKEGYKKAIIKIKEGQKIEVLPR